MPRRIEQVDSFIQEELNNIFLTELELPKNILVTITKVKTDKNLADSFVYLSVLPLDQQTEVMKILKKARGFLRHLLSQKFKGFHVPSLNFVFDDTLIKQRMVEREIENWHLTEPEPKKG